MVILAEAASSRTLIGESERPNLTFACVPFRKDRRPGDQDYESVTCLARTGIHFINLRTGNVLRHDK